MPIVKHSFVIQHPAEIPRVVHEAFHIARTGRPGPVLVDIPQDLSRAEIDYQPVEDVHLPGYQPTVDGNSKQIRLAAKAMANARRPVLYAGRRRRQRRCVGGAARAGADRQAARDLHADGPGRVPGPAPAVARHAGHARHPDRRTTRWTRPT
jgi:thiamine pyrophosphate-dependent acetolactate synthase large subunit-like protein